MEQKIPGSSVVGVGALAFRSPAAPVVGDADLTAVLWAPRVAGADRAAYQREAGPILVESPDGQRVPAGDRSEHYPVARVAPLAAGLNLLGLDLAAPGPLATTVAAAVRTRAPQLSPPVDGAFGASAVLLVEPVFGDTGESRGVVIGVLDLPGFGARALSDLRGGATIVAVAADGARTTIFRRGAPRADGATASVSTFGQRWIVRVDTRPGSSGALLPALALLTVLLAAAIAVLYVAALSRRSRTVARLVDERTREAADARAAFIAAAEAVEEWLFTLCVHPDDRLVPGVRGPGLRPARGTSAGDDRRLDTGVLARHRAPGRPRGLRRRDAVRAARHPRGRRPRLPRRRERRHAAVREKLVPQRAAEAGCSCTASCRTSPTSTGRPRRRSTAAAPTR